jgi:hypothetical protein
MLGGECKHPREYICVCVCVCVELMTPPSLSISESAAMRLRCRFLNRSAAMQFWLPISRIESDAVFAVDF